MTLIETPGKNLRETWTAERVAQLKSFVSAGLTCAQIANEIGVSRNAVIGKLNRLGLSRGRSPAAPRPRSSDVSMRRPQVLTQRSLLKALFASGPVADDVVSPEPCSLLNLAPRKCRWPISGAGTVDFTFCGNATVDGMSYCAGHARMAYRGSSGRPQATPRAVQAAPRAAS
jgi:GcrA cell cycle regulator